LLSHFADAGPGGKGLQPLTTYYYTVFVIAGGISYADAGASVAAMATEDYGLTERLYRMLPSVIQRDDLPPDPAELAELYERDPAIVAALAALPAGLQSRGALARFFYAAAAPLDLMRSTAAAMGQVQNADVAPARFLPVLGASLDWTLDRSAPVSVQRNEVKFAPHLYRTVGTVPTVRAIVNRYSGWHVQVEEFAQSIARSNLPAQLNTFAMVEDGPNWRGTDDAAGALGFGPGNDVAVAPSSTASATLTGSIGPFTLRPGMELAVTADDRLPVGARFAPADFQDMTNAGVSELQAVLSQILSEVRVSVVGGRLTLASNTVGPDSSLRVEQSIASLLSLESAPRGRLTVFRSNYDGQNRIRHFYEMADPTLPQPTNVLQSRVHYKTFRGGEWSESRALATARNVSQGEPAAVELRDGRILAAWVEDPRSAAARLRFAIGTPARPAPAVVPGKRAGPFVIAPGSSLMFHGKWSVPEGFIFSDLDFADPTQATQPEVLAALNSRLWHVRARSGAGNSIELYTVSAGGDQSLVVDLSASTAADALGIDRSNANGLGDWGDTISWSPATDVVAPGRHADLSAVLDRDGVVWLFWSGYDGGRWKIRSSHWDGINWSVPVVLGNQAGGNREPAAALDPFDNIYLFWSALAAPGSADDSWLLWYQFYNPTTAAWSGETPLMTAVPGLQLSGREPSPILFPFSLRLFFSSDRNGSRNIWSVSPIGGNPIAVTSGPQADRWPAPVSTADGKLWLLLRSDRSVAASRLATRSLAKPDTRVTFQVGIPAPSTTRPGSFRMVDGGTIRRYAGSSTVSLGDAARLGRRRLWDDLVVYTPQKPSGGPLQDDDLYTRGTIGLYISQLIPKSQFSDVVVHRLRPVLERFLPINVRSVIILAPRLDIEYVYQPGADIGEFYRDRYPFVEYFAESDSYAVALPDWSWLLSNTLGHVSADPTQLTTLRHRTWYPTPQ
jgi:hypothetical protein